MENERNTYTYTARSAEDVDELVTFTIEDDYLKINFGGVLAEKAEEILAADDKSAVVEEQLKSSIKPVSMQLISTMSKPTHLYDANVKYQNGDLHIWGWQRVARLRLFPFYFIIKSVDNKDSAKAFEKEIQKNKEEAPSINRFTGPLDYWLGWVGLLGIFAFFIKSLLPQKKSA